MMIESACTVQGMEKEDVFDTIKQICVGRDFVAGCTIAECEDCMLERIVEVVGISTLELVDLAGSYPDFVTELTAIKGVLNDLTGIALGDAGYKVRDLNIRTAGLATRLLHYGRMLHSNLLLAVLPQSDSEQK